MSTRFTPDLSAFGDSRFAQLLRNGFVWLRFPKDLEAQFDQFHLQRIRSRARMFFSLWPILETYRIVDALVTGESDVFSVWTLLTLAFIAAGAAALWSSWYCRSYLPGASILAALLLTLNSYNIPTDLDGLIEVHPLRFVLNVPLITYLLLGLPFYRATLINLLCVLAYVISVIQVDAPTVQLVSTVSCIVIATIVAAALAYTTEHSTRTQFLQEQLLSEIASRDGMTGLKNRSALDAHIERLWKLGQTTREPIGMLMLDVDHFKGFNDTLGHQAGDACLRQIAAILKGYVRRPDDMAARYGGEEFAIILFRTPPDQIRAIAEAIRAAVEALGIGNPAAPRKVVTISCGVSIVTPMPARSSHGLIQLADEALYEAKGSGRNCVRSADQSYSMLETGCFRQRGHLRVAS